MKINLLLLLLSTLLGAENLHELITFAQKKNELVVAKQYTQNAKTQELASKKSEYYPTLDLGGFYKRDDAVSPFQAGDVYSGYAKVDFELYDGGRRSAEVNAKHESLKASRFDTVAFQKSLALNITKHFFAIESLQATLHAREEAQKTLKAQLQRVKQFYEAKMATVDDVERVQADFDTNLYDMQTIRFQILSLKARLELIVGKKIEDLEPSKFKKDRSATFGTLEDIQALQSQKNAIQYNADATQSYYYPNIRIEDRYNVYGYERLDPLADQFAKPLDNQNVLLMSVNIRLFDFGRVAKTQEALHLQAAALQSQIQYKTKEQQMHYELAVARITTARLKIESSKSALNAATSAFETIEQKYNAGIVDYIVYLDALTKKTSSKALYESSVNDLEVAYAIYYYYSGKNILEELQ